MKLSIITINLNNQGGLLYSLESVISQNFTDFEFIIIDGHSTDGSVEIIKEFDASITYWVSEPDSGIYHAMNKGLEQAKGEYVLFLNSGDTLYKTSILNDVFPHLSGYDIVYGDLNILQNGNSWVKRYNETLSFGYFLRDTLPHQATFIRREVLLSHGGYDSSLNLASDWKFFIQAICIGNAKVKYVPIIISNYGLDGISSRTESQKLLSLEKHQVLVKYFFRFYADFEQLDPLRVCRNKLNSLKASRFIRWSLWFRNLFFRSKVKL